MITNEIVFMEKKRNFEALYIYINVWKQLSHSELSVGYTEVPCKQPISIEYIPMCLLAILQFRIPEYSLFFY